jgi:mannosyltransferase OCH1-like enzyme
MTIPKRLIRSVPVDTSDQVEAWWQTAQELHPGWDFVTYRDPIDPTGFPLTRDVWPLCQNGAQLAGLVRLEALFNLGGVWLDSDIELYRPLDPLLVHHAFAAWEDAHTVPDAFLGAHRANPAIYDCLKLAVERIQSDSDDWKTGRGAWSTGPGATTTVLTKAPNVTLLPPISVFPVHYSEKERCAQHPGRDNPNCYGMHWWAASWL